MIEATDYQIRKGLVSLTLQENLLEFGDDTLEKVSKRLFEYHNCYLPDCYDNPLFLGKVLKELFGNSNIIIESIKDSLSGFVTQKPIAEFLDSLSMFPEQRTILCRGELN
jgi:hypothetical protein